MKIKIRVPATTANLGSGFDCLGAALELYNEMEVAWSKSSSRNLRISVEGEGKGKLPLDSGNIFYRGMKKVFDISGYRQGSVEIRMKNNIPLARGLGSSASAYVGGIIAGNKISGSKLSQEEMINIAAGFEGHPDNVVPAMLGGLCISYKKKNSEIGFLKINMGGGIRSVLCIPEFELKTKDARKVLPGKVSMRDAVFNSSRTALFIAAIKEKKYRLLADAMQDSLHQGYRAKLVPGLQEILDKAVSGGALGAALSGSGPAILAITPGERTKSEKTGRLMTGIFRKYGINSRYIIANFNNKGAEIIK